MPSYEDAFSYYNTPNHKPTMEPSKNTQNKNDQPLDLAEKILVTVFTSCAIVALIMWLHFL